MSAGGRDEERRKLADIIHHWNANRLDLFEISQPTEVSDAAAAGAREGRGRAQAGDAEGGRAQRGPAAAPPPPARPPARPRTRPRPRPCPPRPPPTVLAGRVPRGPVVLVASRRAPPPGWDPRRLGGPRSGRAGHLRPGTHLELHACPWDTPLLRHPRVSPDPTCVTGSRSRRVPVSSEPAGLHLAAHLCPHNPPVPPGPHLPHAALCGPRASLPCGVPRSPGRTCPSSPRPVSLMASS